MDPITIISAATSILKATGLDEKLGDLIMGKRGAEVAKKVVDIAQDVTGTTDLDSMKRETESDPMVTHEITLALMDQETELVRLAMGDRADARAMQTAALKQPNPEAKLFIYRFAWFWSAIAAAFIFLIVLYPIPTTNVRFADTVLGFVLGTIIATILQFFYGSMLKQDSDG